MLCKDIRTFLKTKPALLQKIQSQLQSALKDTAAVNATRYAILDTLQQFQLPIRCGSGGQTKYNRTTQGYTKDHWIDAACVGTSGVKVKIPPKMHILTIIAVGRGTRQMCLTDKYGFPRAGPKQKKRKYGFQTGDIVYAKVLKGKKIGKYMGRVAIRATGNFNITTKTGTIQGIHYRFCEKVHCFDGYNYL